MFERFPVEPAIGARVELIHCSDVWTRMTPGTKGTVRFIDSTGTVFVDWDPTYKERADGTRQVFRGSNLGLVYDHGDRFRIL